MSEKTDRLYDVMIEYLGIKKKDNFPMSTICLGKEGDFMVMDAEGKTCRFVAYSCKVEQIAARVIILSGFTLKPRHIKAYCVYSGITKGGEL